MTAAIATVITIVAFVRIAIVAIVRDIVARFLARFLLDRIAENYFSF